MNPYLTSQDEAKLIKPVIIKYNHMGVKYAIRRVWSVIGKHNVHHMARLVGKGLSCDFATKSILNSLAFKSTSARTDINCGIFGV